MSVRQAELVTALYDYSGADQAQGLPLAAGCIVVVLERLDAGWCRGEYNSRQGWFPASYVQPAQTNGWVAFITEEGRVYYQSPVGTSYWTIPEGGFVPVSSSVSVTSNDSMTVPDGPRRDSAISAGAGSRRGTLTQTGTSKGNLLGGSGGGGKASKGTQSISCLTYPDTEAEIADQQSLAGSSYSYVDHFWSDKGEQSGLDVMVGKNTRGKTAIKEMSEFMRERAAIEDQYSKALAKLARTQYGDCEEGTLRETWREIRSGVQATSASHASLATKLLNDVERPMSQYLETNKKNTKKHEQKITDDRKAVRKEFEQVERSRMAYDKVDARKDRRRYQAAVEDLKQQIDRYNSSQYKWVEDMIAVAGDMEQYENERHKFVRDMVTDYTKMLRVLISEHETTTLSQERMQDKCDATADQRAWVTSNETGRVRPVDMK
ncbi:growth arrest-specific protein 7-like [Sycon ciliatum]|uniref:growth arrest-specific protein 7-like n=1 Tax=Sycon ciliatum TaxID=27933 RepID=UPI0020AEDADF|eukprot:scpid50865/ scgid30099/ Growth arrest-specific protein 7